MKGVLRMATSSITRNFVVSGKNQVEAFADAIEESYQESLREAPAADVKVTYLRGAEEIKKFMLKRQNSNV